MSQSQYWRGKRNHMLVHAVHIWIRNWLGVKVQAAMCQTRHRIHFHACYISVVSINDYDLYPLLDMMK